MNKLRRVTHHPDGSTTTTYRQMTHAEEVSYELRENDVGRVDGASPRAIESLKNTIIKDGEYAYRGDPNVTN